MNREDSKLTDIEFKQLCQRLVGHTPKDPNVEIIGVYRGEFISVSILVKEEYGNSIIMVKL